MSDRIRVGQFVLLRVLLALGIVLVGVYSSHEYPSPAGEVGSGLHLPAGGER